MKGVIIVGSSHKNGATKKVALKLAELTNWEVVDLNNYKISQYNHNHQNKGDDFLPLMKQLVQNYNCLVFATPVYWYAMSGTLKKFFDRFTDLLTIEKETGRKLRGKYMAVITSSSGDNLGEFFWLPFKKTSDYLGIEFVKGLHTIQGKDYKNEMVEFAKAIKDIQK